ncbi:MAG: helix-turn-helix transcriptional regulator [Acidimicrobiales bacterium]
MTKPGSPGRPDELAAITALGEPKRRALYDFIAGAGDWVSRDQAADAIGLERGTAAHHLERLAADGLLDVDYKRLTGRQGPGAGRPAKLYRRARRDFEVSLPPRDYELAGHLLARAADTARTDGTDIVTALDQVASAEGRRLAEEIRARLARSRDRRSATNRERALLATLQEHGFEPSRRGDGTVVLRNCPFHQLARRHTHLICGMNLCLMAATVEAVGGTGLDARLEPEDGVCCVRLHQGSMTTLEPNTTSTGDPRAPRRPDDEGDEGGDPACWAHLFEDAETAADAADGDGPR